MISYDIDRYYRETLTSGQPKDPNAPPGKEKKKLKGWRVTANGGYDHQFFEVAKLDALEEKENNWIAYVNAPNQDEYLKANNLLKPPTQFNKRDLTTKETLLSQGFSTWSKKDFFLFLRLAESYGRDDLESIGLGFPNKTLDEVKRYSEAFWKKWQKIESGQKYVERIEKGEAEIERQRLTREAIDQKMEWQAKAYKQKEPEDQELLRFSVLSITFEQLPPEPAKKTSNQASLNPLFDYTEDEDRFLSSSLYTYGYG